MTGLEWVLAALGIVILLGICGIVVLVLIVRAIYPPHPPQSTPSAAPCCEPAPA